MESFLYSREKIHVMPKEQNFWSDFGHTIVQFISFPLSKYQVCCWWGKDKSILCSQIKSETEQFLLLLTNEQYAFENTYFAERAEGFNQIHHAREKLKCLWKCMRPLIQVSNYFLQQNSVIFGYFISKIVGLLYFLNHLKGLTL